MRRPGTDSTPDFCALVDVADREATVNTPQPTVQTKRDHLNDAASAPAGHRVTRLKS